MLNVAPSKEVGHRKSLVELALRCGDKVRASLSLPVVWRVESAIVARPRRLYLDRLGPGDRIARTFLVSSIEGDEFSLIGVRCSMPDALVSANFDDYRAMTHSVTVEIKPPVVKGAWAADLIIDTDDERVPHITLPVAGLVANDIAAE